MSAPEVKGWCPGALRPMMSGDGLVVRIRPVMGRLSQAQVLGLCDIADEFGNGTIDLTSRANLQLRGVAHHGLVVTALQALDLIDDDVRLEDRRNITMHPFWQPGDSSAQLHDAICQGLPDWPELPRKMGVAIDTGPARSLTQASADFRFETAGDGGVILRADGAETGFSVTAQTASAQLIALMTWFIDTGGAQAGRMRRHLQRVTLPDAFQGCAPAPAETHQPGQTPLGPLVGVPFGQMLSDDLRQVMAGAQGLRTTPWRLILLEQGVDTGAFIPAPGDPRLNLFACPGAPACAQAQGPTRALAHALGPHVTGDALVHVSGCAKGCAYAKPADVTIVAHADGYALVTQGAAWDRADRTGLSAQEIIEELANAL